MEFLRIAHVSSTIGSWCLIGSVVTFAFYKRPYSTTWLRCQNQNLFIKIGIINDWPFLYRQFCMKIDRIFDNCSCFIDYRLLMLYRIYRNFCVLQGTILHNMTTLSESKSVKKCRSYYERPFLHRHFSIKIDGIFKNCSCFIDYRLLMLYRILLNFCVWQETILHNMTTLSESKSVQKSRNY